MAFSGASLNTMIGGSLSNTSTGGGGLPSFASRGIGGSSIGGWEDGLSHTSTGAVYLENGNSISLKPINLTEQDILNNPGNSIYNMGGNGGVIQATDVPSDMHFYGNNGSGSIGNYDFAAGKSAVNPTGDYGQIGSWANGADGSFGGDSPKLQGQMLSGTGATGSVGPYGGMDSTSSPYGGLYGDGTGGGTTDTTTEGGGVGGIPTSTSDDPYSASSSAAGQVTAPMPGMPLSNEDFNKQQQQLQKTVQTTAKDTAKQTQQAAGTGIQKIENYLSDLFIRGGVIVLGLIFVAFGLLYLSGHSPVATTKKAAKGLALAAA